MERVVVRRGQIWRVGWVIKTLETQVGPFLLGCKCPASRGIVVQEQDPVIIYYYYYLLQLIFSLGGGSPYTCTDKTNENKYT
jgi:hypothetical protein